MPKLTRRHFIATSAALAAAPAWAATRARLVTGAMDRANQTFLAGLTEAGTLAFLVPTPGRAHAAAAHPHRAEAVMIARRPGLFALVVDVAQGTVTQRLDAPEGRHFYGHGAYTADGTLLLTTENAFDDGEGRIGIWDVTKGYARVGDLPSGGIGPHQILRLPSGGFAVANGGIQTHPDFGRAKLNLATMRTNLTYLTPEGAIADQVEMPEALRKNSIRHIVADAAGRIYAALQWQGDPRDAVPLAARHEAGQPLTLWEHPETARLKQYAGSIALSGDETEAVLTGPHGDHMIFFDAATGAPLPGRAMPVPSGAERLGQDLVVTVGGGLAIGKSASLKPLNIPGGYSWDNHLVAI